MCLCNLNNYSPGRSIPQAVAGVKRGAEHVYPQTTQRVGRGGTDHLRSLRNLRMIYDPPAVSPRRKAAHSSGSEGLIQTPLPSSKPALRLRRGTMAMYQWK